MRFLLVLIGAAIFASATMARGDEKREPNSFEGNWRSTSLEHQGFRTKLDGRMRVQGEQGACEEFPVHTTIRFSKLKAGHLVIDIGLNRLKLKGRYEVKGDELRIAFDFSEPTKRPKSFRSKPGSDLMVVTFARQTPSEAAIEALTNIFVERAFGLGDTAERILTMEKGAGERVGKIYITGNDKVPDEAIRRCLDIYPGQRLWIWRLYLAEVRLAGSGKFEVNPLDGVRPRIRVVWNEDGSFHDVVVEVKERR